MSASTRPIVRGVTRAVTRALTGALGVNPSFWAPLETSIVPTIGVGSATFTRATTATVQDWEGRIYNVLSGEARFKGLRRVYNLYRRTQDLTSAGTWAFANATTATGITDPFGGTTAIRITATAINATMGTGTIAPAAGSRVTYSMWIRRVTGTGAIFTGRGASDITAAVTASWQRIAVTITSDGGNPVPVKLAVSGDAVEIAFLQAENVTGQSNENPSEYVSVDVESAPYHGANVDGVKYFKTLNGNTVSGNVVTEATGDAIPAGGIGIAWLPGLTGSYFQANDNNVLDITGDIDIRCTVAADNYASGVLQGLVVKQTGARAYEFHIDAAGILRFVWRDSTLTTRTSTSDAFTLPTNGTRITYRVTMDVDNGAGGHTITYWQATAGINGPWTQLGATKSVGAFTTDIAATTDDMLIGAVGAARANPFKGNIYRAQVYNGINGTLAMDFDPQQWTSGASFTSGGLTFALNGGATVLKFPVDGYHWDQQTTNLVLQSENFGTTWTTSGTPTRVAAALRCGSIVLDLLGDDDAGVAECFLQSATFTGDGVKAISYHFAQGSATSSVFRVNDLTAVANRLLAAVTWVNGIPTVTMTTGTLLGVDSLGNGVFRARFLTSAITAANNNSVQVWPATTTGFAAANTGTIYCGGVQAENNAVFCGDYVPTAAATVTKNADRLTYPTAGNVLATVGTLYVEANILGDGAAGNIGLFSPSNAGSGIYTERSTATARFADGTNTVQRAGLTGNVRHAVAGTYTGAVGKVFSDGVVTSGAFDGDLNLGINMSVGGNSTADGIGSVKNAKAWQVALDDATVAAIPLAA